MIPVGSKVLLVASPEDTPAAAIALQEHGLTIGKRISTNVKAIVCVPRKASLSSSALKQLGKYQESGLPIVDYDALAGASSVAACSTCAGTQRKRQSSGDGSVPAEKRRARWLRSCSSATFDRIDRALEQRMYLVEQKNIKPCTAGGPARQYVVLGSTGNVYSVVVSDVVSCDCPDAAKGNACKHQLFVFLRVLRVPPSSNLIYQRALLSAERTELFARAKRAERGAIATSSVREAYAEATGEKPTNSSSSSASHEALAALHRGDEGDECPICFEPLGSESLEVCQACRNAVHEDCFRRWAGAQGRSITCPLCRADWAQPNSKVSSSQQSFFSRHGYINLASAAGLNCDRDE